MQAYQPPSPTPLQRRPCQVDNMLPTYLVRWLRCSDWIFVQEIHHPQPLSHHTRKLRDLRSKCSRCCCCTSCYCCCCCWCCNSVALCILFWEQILKYFTRKRKSSCVCVCAWSFELFLPFHHAPNTAGRSRRAAEREREQRASLCLSNGLQWQRQRLRLRLLRLLLIAISWSCMRIVVVVLLALCCPHICESLCRLRAASHSLIRFVWRCSC